MEDPALTPHGFRDDEIGALSAQEVPEPGARTNLSRALMGTRKFRRAGCQVVASSDIPPPLTRR